MDMNSQQTHPHATNRLAYEALSPLGHGTAHVRFKGTFEQQEVTWDARILTLAEVYRHLQHSGQIASGASASLRQYIEIADRQDELQPVTIALNVPTIDAPTVFKSIVMIHNYKRLHHGRHEYGAAQTFP